MKKVDAIVRAERMPHIKERLRDMGVAGMTILTVMGWSKTRELHLQWRGQPVSYDLEPIPKLSSCRLQYNSLNILKQNSFLTSFHI